MASRTPPKDKAARAASYSAGLRLPRLLCSRCKLYQFSMTPLPNCLCGEVEGGEARCSSGGERLSSPPGIESEQVDGGGCEDVCESGLP